MQCGHVAFVYIYTYIYIFMSVTHVYVHHTLIVHWQEATCVLVGSVLPASDSTCLA